MTWPDGQVYEGQYVGGKMHGLGTLTLANKDKYQGRFEADMQHGRGVYNFSQTGELKQGQWKHGKLVHWL